MTRKITTAEVLELYGIDRARLKVWMREGLRASGKRRVNGGMTHVFNPAKLAHWCAAHGKNPKGIEGAMLKAAAQVQPPTSPNESGQAPRKVVDPPAQLEAVRGQYAALQNRFVALARANAPDTDVAAISRALTAKGTELRQLEMSVLEWKTKTGALCDYAEMQRLFVDLASGVRERIMALPNELAPVLREYLRDPDDAVKVRDEIDQAIRHALAALPDELPGKEV